MSNIILPDELSVKSISDLSKRQLKNTIDEFDALLKMSENKKATENQYQSFFDQNPFIFTESIPLKFDSIYSQVRLNSGPVDYLFHKSASSIFFSTTGIIEIKRPDHSIIDVYGSHLSFLKNSNRAMAQTKDYLKDLNNSTNLIKNNMSLAIGNHKAVFIIIGMEKELLKKCHNEIIMKKFNKLFPPGVQILTYDYIFKNLLMKAPLTPTFHFLIVGKQSEINDKLFKAKYKGKNMDMPHPLSLFDSTSQNKFDSNGQCNFIVSVIQTPGRHNYDGEEKTFLLIFTDNDGGETCYRYETTFKNFINLMIHLKIKNPYNGKPFYKYPQYHQNRYPMRLDKLMIDKIFAGIGATWYQRIGSK